MKTHIGIVLATLSMAVVAVALIVWFRARPTDTLPQAYHNDALGLSLRLPGSFTITETKSTNPPEENSPVEIIEFSDAQGNIQLTATPASYASSPLTVESLLSDYPSIGSETVKPFPIGASAVGLAIDNDPSRPTEVSDVWFARGGYLYQLTAFGDAYQELLPVAETITLQ